jgi:hypothetical protein
MIKRPTPSPRLQAISFFSIDNNGSGTAVISFFKSVCDIIFPHAQPASGGLTPLKNNQEIRSPAQITNPNRLTK